MHGRGAVSYTHQDVYKRQELNLMQYTNDDTPKQGKEILNDALIAEMKKINPDCETEYYSVFYLSLIHISITR